MFFFKPCVCDLLHIIPGQVPGYRNWLFFLSYSGIYRGTEPGYFGRMYSGMYPRTNPVCFDLTRLGTRVSNLAVLVILG